MHAVAPNTVVATMNTGVNPAGIGITPNNRFAYVVNNNNYGIAGQDSVTVLRLSDNQPIKTIQNPFFNEPYTVTIDRLGNKAYVTNSNSTTVAIIDLITDTVSGIITGFDGPSGLAISHDGTRAYVNNYGGPGGLGSGNGSSIDVIDLINDVIVGPPILVDQAPAALAITPDGSRLYVANYVDGNPGTGTVQAIQTSNNSVIDTITGFSGPFDIAITPDGARAYVTNFGSNNFYPFGRTIGVIDLNANSLIDTIHLHSIQPASIAITPDNRYAYVTNYNTLYSDPSFSELIAGAGTVNIIDLSTNDVLTPTIEVDQSPAGIAISSDGRYAYVTNYTSNTVNVIALANFEILNAQGCQTQNRFLMETDLINKLTWSVSGEAPVSYSLYRDAALTDLIATIPATTQPLQYLDHNVQPNITYTYYLVGNDSNGVQSVPVVIVVDQSC
jgi:YVTN family beta-propeller protein